MHVDSSLGSIFKRYMALQGKYNLLQMNNAKLNDDAENYSMKLDNMMILCNNNDKRVYEEKQQTIKLQQKIDQVNIFILVL